MVAIAQLRPASCAQALSRPEGPARTTRGGGAKRRALHGAEHSSRLDGVMAAGNVLPGATALSLPGRGSISAVTADDRRAARADVADDHTAETGDDYSGERQPGRERPSLESAPGGEVGRSKAGVAHAPGPCCDCSVR